MNLQFSGLSRLKTQDFVIRIEFDWMNFDSLLLKIKKKQIRSNIEKLYKKVLLPLFRFANNCCVTD
jgi:hypothetical protein